MTELKDLTSGALRWPIQVIGRATDDQLDENGVPQNNPVDRFTTHIWAAKEEMQASEKAGLSQEISTQLVTFYCRYHAEITRDDEIVCDGKRYAIVSIASDQCEWMTIVSKLMEAPIDG